jgi:hypothetical protein
MKTQFSKFTRATFAKRVARIGVPVLRILCAGALAFPVRLIAEPSTIDPNLHHAWGANIGWLDFRGAGPHGAVVSEYVLSGYVYSANCGWISLGNGVPAQGGVYSNTSASDFGVIVLPHFSIPFTAFLRGVAYGANIGWIHFESTGDPRLDLRTGAFRGYAWSANCGWLNLGELGVVLETDAITPGLDSDGDQIPDAWEWSLFPGDLAAIGIATDQDSDGVLDRDEYLAETDPFDNTSALGFTAFDVNSSGTLTTLTWTSRSGRLYRIWHTSDLNLPWSIGESNINPTGALTTRTIASPSALRRFYRVEAFRPLFLTPP